MSNAISMHRWASALRILSILALVGLAALLAFAILFAPISADILEPAGVTDRALVAGTRRAMIAAIGAIPSLAILYVLAQMAGLFGHYARGDLLSADCAGFIRRIGIAVLVGMALEGVMRPLQIMIASYVNPPGERVLAIALHGADIGQLLAGGLLLTIGWAMQEAAEIASENRQFV